MAREVAGACPGRCESSCIDCLQSFRNAYHRYLDLGGKILYRLGYPNRAVRRGLEERLFRGGTVDKS